MTWGINVRGNFPHSVRSDIVCHVSWRVKRCMNRRSATIHGIRTTLGRVVTSSVTSRIPPPSQRTPEPRISRTSDTISDVINQSRDARPILYPDALCYRRRFGSGRVDGNSFAQCGQIKRWLNPGTAREIDMGDWVRKRGKHCPPAQSGGADTLRTVYK